MSMTERKCSEKFKPGFLVFDLLCPGVLAMERYRRPAARDGKVPPNVSLLRAAGDRRCMTKEFLASLPHEAAGVMWLGPPEDPFKASGVEAAV